LNHPGIIKIHGVVLDKKFGENLAIVLEYHSMGSLNDVIYVKKAPLTPALRTKLIISLVQAVDYIHRYGLGRLL